MNLQKLDPIPILAVQRFGGSEIPILKLKTIIMPISQRFGMWFKRFGKSGSEAVRKLKQKLLNLIKSGSEVVMFIFIPFETEKIITEPPNRKNKRET